MVRRRVTVILAFVALHRLGSRLSFPLPVLLRESREFCRTAQFRIVVKATGEEAHTTGSDFLLSMGMVAYVGWLYSSASFALSPSTAGCSGQVETVSESNLCH